jgi:hypothetical protein
MTERQDGFEPTPRYLCGKMPGVAPDAFKDITLAEVQRLRRRWETFVPRPWLHLELDRSSPEYQEL